MKWIVNLFTDSGKKDMKTGSEVLEYLKSKLSEDGKEASLDIHPVYDAATNMVHYQTKPYMENGVIKVSRVASIPVVVENVYQSLEEVKS